MSYGSVTFEAAVIALRKLHASERIRALYEADIREIAEVHEQNEADARAAGYPNLISMQADGEFEVCSKLATNLAVLRDAPVRANDNLRGKRGHEMDEIPF